MNKENVSQKELLAKLEYTLKDVLQSLDWEKLCRYNQGYKRYREDPFLYFVHQEWPYYWHVYNWFRENVRPGSKVLDVGMFIPVMPLLLSWAGYEVICVEKFELYGGALDKVAKLIDENGVMVVDDDIIYPKRDYPDFDVICVLCLLEHLLGSPKRMIHNLRQNLGAAGKLVVAVPNHARLVNRLGLMFGGLSIHPNFENYFESDYPFEGHHREYTKKELEYLLKTTGFRIDRVSSVNYSPINGSAVQSIITRIASLLPPTFHQVLIAYGTKR